MHTFLLSLNKSWFEITQQQIKDPCHKASDKSPSTLDNQASIKTAVVDKQAHIKHSPLHPFIGLIKIRHHPPSKHRFRTLIQKLLSEQLTKIKQLELLTKKLRT
jgi:hypothetical protein